MEDGIESLDESIILREMFACRHHVHEVGTSCKYKFLVNLRALVQEANPNGVDTETVRASRENQACIASRKVDFGSCVPHAKQAFANSKVLTCQLVGSHRMLTFSLLHLGCSGCRLG